MASYQPAYRLRLYSPRSVDSSESTVLTPILGASHSDAFQVATISGLSGYQPYLEPPRGKMGSIDPLTRKWSQANLSVRVMDKRVTAGGSNATRWLSAFLGDASGKHRLIGCKVVIEERLTSAGAWTAFFTGRVQGAELSSDAIFIDLNLRDLSAELDRQVFVGRPHASATYAFMPAIIPIGLPSDWGANFKAQARLTATLHRISSTVAYLELAKSNDFRLARLTRGAQALANQEVVLTSGASTGRFRVNWQGGASVLSLDPFGSIRATKQKLTFLFIKNIEELPATAPGYLAMPADGATVTFYLTADAPPTKDFPLLVSNVNVVTFWRDLTQGYFSKLKPDGSARAIAPTNAAAFTALEADAPTGSFILDGPMKYIEFVEKHLCQVYGYGYRLSAAGEVVPIDMRRASTLASGGTITDANLVAGGAPQWQLSRDLVRAAAQVTYYLDRAAQTDAEAITADGLLDYPSHGVISTTFDVLVVNDDTEAWMDAGEKVLKLDAIGLRVQEGAVTASGENVLAPTVQKATELGKIALQPFTSPPGRLPLVCRRGDSAVDNCQPGDLRTVNVTTQPNPGSNVRGGARLMRCLSRTEDGLAIRLEFLDMGPGTVATAPSITSAAVAAADPNRIDVAVTLNAASERAVVRYAVTAAGTGARPADTSALWTFGGDLLASGTVKVRNVPAGMRIWIAARSEPLGPDAKLPSAWIYLGGTGYVDTTAITAASGISVTSVFANRFDIAWTVGDATARQEVYLNAGGIPGTWTEAMKVASLEPNTGKYRAKNLTASTTYGIGILQRDAMGGKSSFLTTTQATSGTAGTAPAMLGIAVCVTGV